MGLLLRINLTLHVLAAVYWVGEALFDALVLGPVLRSLSGRPWINELQERLRPRLAYSTWVSLSVLVVSGVLNMVLLRLPVGQRGFWRTGYGTTLLFKLLVVAAIITLTLVHHFVQIPVLRRLRLQAAEAAPDEAAVLLEAYRTGRRRAAGLARTAVGLAVVAVILGVWLVTGV